MKLEEILRDIGGRKATGRNVPVELAEFACYVPDSGYCIMCIPEIFADESETQAEMYCVPLPEKYVLEKGWRFLDNGFPCVDVPYDEMLGAVVDEKYDTWR